MPIFSEEEDQQLFEDLRRLIYNVGYIAKNYPALYRLYLKVATPNRIEKIKGKEAVVSDKGT